MWNRQELKLRGKKAFKDNYWKCVLVGLIMTVADAGFSIKETIDLSVNSANNQMMTQSLSDLIESATPHLTGPAGFGVSIFTIAVTILLLNPAVMGCSNFFLNNRRDPTTGLKPLGLPFSNHYGNIVKTLLLRDVFIFLWSLLFVIPGIIKSYQYRLVPFILSENPDMDYKDALERSNELMYGSKMAAFILDLSFIGWGFFAGITLGIGGIFFVFPYIYATEAELYITLAHPEEAQRVGLAVPDAKTVEFEVKENK